MSDNTSATATFCRELREARQFRNVTIAEVAAITRVSTEYLIALETGDWAAIPGAFIRGYLRLYASAVGMNCEKVLRTFDAVTGPLASEGGAILDDSPPLLRQPEHRGVTRAKIRTSWFAALSQNRRASYLLTVLLIALLVGAVYAVRHLPRREATILSWSESLIDYRRALRGPRVTLGLGQFSEEPSQDRLPSGSRQCELRASADGVVVYTCDGGTPGSLRYGAYDTLILCYMKYIDVKLFPPSSADIFQDSVNVYGSHEVSSPDTVRILLGTFPGHEDSVLLPVCRLR